MPTKPESRIASAWAAQAGLNNLRKRVNRARKFPDNTCAASRHLHMIAEQLATGESFPMTQDIPLHCAATMLSVLESLWKARTVLAKLMIDANRQGDA